MSNFRFFLSGHGFSPLLSVCWFSQKCFSHPPTVSRVTRPYSVHSRGNSSWISAARTGHLKAGSRPVLGRADNPACCLQHLVHARILIGIVVAIFLPARKKYCIRISCSLHTMGSPVPTMIVPSRRSAVRSIPSEKIHLPSHKSPTKDCSLLFFKFFQKIFRSSCHGLSASASENSRHTAHLKSAPPPPYNDKKEKKHHIISHMAVGQLCRYNPPPCQIPCDFCGCSGC